MKIKRPSKDQICIFFTNKAYIALFKNLVIPPTIIDVWINNYYTVAIQIGPFAVEFNYCKL